MAPLAKFEWSMGNANHRSQSPVPRAHKPMVQASPSTEAGLTVTNEHSFEITSVTSEDHGLSRSWSLWEKQVSTDHMPTSESESEESDAGAHRGINKYNASINLVKDFNSIETFMELFNGVPPPSAIVNRNHIYRQLKSPFDITTDEDTESDTESHCSKARSNSILGRRPIPGVIRETRQLDAIGFFESGVKPVWEDAAHKNGGVMEFTFKTDFPGGAIDEIWERLLFTILGNGLPNGEFITGVRMADRLPPKMAHNNAIVGVRLEIWHREMTQKMTELLRQNCTECITAPLLYGGSGHARRTVHKGSFATKTPILYCSRAPVSNEREAEIFGGEPRRGSV